MQVLELEICLLVGSGVDLEWFLFLDEPLRCFMLEVHWRTFGALVGAWRLKVLEIGALEVVSVDSSWLSAFVHFFCVCIEGQLSVRGSNMRL